MMRKQLLLVFLLLVAVSMLFSQQVESVAFIRGYDAAELSSQLGMPVQNGVDFYKIRYTTMGSDGQPDIASGLIVLPQNSAPELPLIIYHHGTTIAPDRVPSSLNLDYEAYAWMGGNGYAVLAPDYLGLGDSRGFHPYVHKNTLASASIDMLKAFHQWAAVEDVALSGHLFLTGYSQGGFAGMATHQKLQEEYAGQFDVTAAAHLSGPYSLSGAMRDLMFSEENYNYIGFVPFAILGFQEVYGDVYNSLEDIFRPDYVSFVESFYQGALNLVELTILMSLVSMQLFANTHPVNVFNPDLVEAMLVDDDHPLNQILRENDAYNWTPEAPTRLWYCLGDDQVPPANSLVAFEAMQQNGAINLIAEDLGSSLNHTQCAEPAIMAALEFFNSFVAVSIVENNDWENHSIVFPNPVHDIIMIVPGRVGEDFHVAISDLAGRVVLSAENESRVDLSWLESGMYMLTLTGSGFSATHKIYKR